MKKASAAIFGLALSVGLLAGQTSRVPSFKFFREAEDAARDKKILARLNRDTVQPDRAQQRAILQSLLNKDLIPKHFAAMAGRFRDAVDQEMKTEYAAWIVRLPDADLTRDIFTDENGNPPSLEEMDEWKDPQTSPYAFRCLDFDGDHEVDLIIFGRVYFGPSAGLVFYGRGEGGFRYLFDCSGAIVEIQRTKDLLALRFVVTIIDPSEAEILASIAYDFKSKTSRLDSKLYYAQRTEFPKTVLAPRPFVVREPVLLRVDPRINDTENVKNAQGYYEYETTRTLFGNVVAEFPKSAGGFVLDERRDWAFVAFASDVPPRRSSLNHGMEPGRYVDEVWTPEYRPGQYYCGWIDKKYLARKP